MYVRGFAARNSCLPQDEPVPGASQRCWLSLDTVVKTWGSRSLLLYQRTSVLFQSKWLRRWEEREVGRYSCQRVSARQEWRRSGKQLVKHIQNTSYSPGPFLSVLSCTHTSCQYTHTCCTSTCFTNGITNWMCETFYIFCWEENRHATAPWWETERTIIISSEGSALFHTLTTVCVCVWQYGHVYITCMDVVPSVQQESGIGHTAHTWSHNKISDVLKSVNC